MRFRGGFIAALGIAALLRSGTAMAAIDDLQIDWVIPAGAIDEKALNEGERRQVVVRPIPRKMFVSGADIVSTSGLKLLPAGAPLYAMVGPVFMVCSQTTAPQGYVAKGNRVCLRDTDGDGRLDSYFTRSRGRSFMTGDQMWYAMNNNVPKPAGTIQSVELTEADRTQAPERPVLDVGFSAQKDGTIRIGIVIEGAHTFSTRCVETGDATVAGNGKIFLCMDPGFTVHRKSVATSADKPAFDLTIVVSKRELAVRFDVAPRLMGARLMNGMYFE